MVIVKECNYIDATTVHLTLYTDALSELSTASNIPVPQGYNIQPGSFAYDKSGNIAVYDSNKSWNTIE